MHIYTSPDPVLREVCEPVELGDKSMKRTAKQMLKEMYKADGVGLAAPQVGLLKRLVVIDTTYVQEDEDGKPLGKKPLVMINPEIVDHSEEQYDSSEGCLSLPGTRKALRYERIEVTYRDLDFKKQKQKFSGLTAEIIQHEIDHCNGILI